MANHTPFRLVVHLLALLAAIGTIPGQPVSAQHARVELLARQSVAAPDADLQLGVHLVLEPGWHIYWTNPGDSGQPPSFKWQLPPGFSAGEIQWPRPERMHPSKEIADYGYHDEVLLPLTVHVPPGLNSGEPVEIAAKAKWLICREVCIPEHADLHLTLPAAASNKANDNYALLFQKTMELLPRPLPDGWRVSASSAKDRFILTLRSGKTITRAEFFPLDPGQIDNPAPQLLQPMPNGTKITLKKSDLLLTPITVLRGVLVISGGPAYRIEAPVRESLQ